MLVFLEVPNRWFCPSDETRHSKSSLDMEPQWPLQSQTRRRTSWCFHRLGRSERKATTPSSRGADQSPWGNTEIWPEFEWAWDALGQFGPSAEASISSSVGISPGRQVKSNLWEPLRFSMRALANSIQTSLWRLRSSPCLRLALWTKIMRPEGQISLN